MQVQDIAIVVLVVSTFCVFGSILGFASWEETRRSRKSRK